MPLAEAVADFTTSVVCGKDVVPRTSVSNIGRLLDDMVRAGLCTHPQPQLQQAGSQVMHAGPPGGRLAETCHTLNMLTRGAAAKPLQVTPSLDRRNLHAGGCARHEQVQQERACAGLAGPAQPAKIPRRTVPPACGYPSRGPGCAGQVRAGSML